MKPVDHAIKTLEHNLGNHGVCSVSHCPCINMRVALCNLRDKKEKISGCRYCEGEGIACFADGPDDYHRDICTCSLETIEELLVGIYQ